METPTPLASLQQDVAALAAVWAGALPAFGVLPSDAQGSFELMSGSGLVSVTDALTRLRRTTDALLVRAAGEVGRRSGPEFGTEGLAKKNGFSTPTRLLASSTGGSTGEAARLLAVGAATASRQDFSGQARPARHPHVAAALDAGLISVDAAGAITGMLDRVAPRADAAVVEGIEKILAERAAELPLSLLLRVIKQAEARLDPDGADLRDEERWLGRSLTIRENRHGMTELTARLDPESASLVTTAIEALVSDGLRAKSARADDEPVITDDRSIPQRQADALVEIMRHVLGCTQTIAPLAAVTTVTRIDLDALRTGLGSGSIDGIDQPVSAGTIRRLAASADLIPMVLGTDSVPLDVGRTARLFTKTQRLALHERDGGCASCGQNINYTHAHHIRWWKRHHGPTDITNGVLLCSFCHHMIHRDGWNIHATPTEVWFIPPPHVDPDQVPRLGGKARFSLPRSAAA
ncbi:HNH endonuclease signature motif containing protein [Leifsonia flava]|uniref:HNH endonuclease n=1 Tax=Orlajensenia leifsoniae TaxID=2561933 RepID=A0A4Y9QV82_9MICO|nr:HNH endonuclease signature motif containing protein [Leifsonia flava]TFV95382.1 HNH endonuclease [Leifsonia flava]